MIIYSTTLWLETNTDGVLAQLAAWLSDKFAFAGRAFTVEELEAGFSPVYLEEYSLLSRRCRDSTPMLYWYQFREPCHEVEGRLWVTEIGIQDDPNADYVECSILLQTEDRHVRPSDLTAVTTTRPALVHQLIANCYPGPQTPGAALHTLAAVEDAQALRRRLDGGSIRHPVVIVSPRQDDGYLTDVEAIYDQLKGLADVVVIERGVDPYAISEALGRTYAAWGGAVKVILPDLPGSRHPTPLLYTPTKIETTEDFAHLLLDEVAHRVNWGNSRYHIGGDRITKRERERQLDQLRQRLDRQSSAQVDQFIATFDAEQANLTLQIEALQSANQELEFQKSLLREQNERLRSGEEDDGTVEPLEQRLRAGLSRLELPPEYALKLIEAFYPNRVVILKSAWRSAKRSDRFQDKSWLVVRLWRLVTEYWELLHRGGSDEEAKNSIFTVSEFSGRDSETVEGNERARKLRTFPYKDQDVLMFRHLKRGIGQSATDSIRVYFHWDPEDEKIVIGYCGRHLDHK